MEDPKSRRERAAALLSAPGLRSLASLVPMQAGLVVLNYHRIARPDSPPPDRGLWSATPEQFAAEMDILRGEFEVVSAAELPAALQAPRGRYAMVTFDDGYRDNYELAFPILRAVGMPATFFLSTGYLDRPRLSWWDEIAWMIERSSEPRPQPALHAATDRYKSLPAARANELLDELAERTGSGRAPESAAEGVWMNWDMAREMRDAGMAFGGHTVDHPVLARLDRDGQMEEIDGCRCRLREELDTEMSLFSYPVGLPDCFDESTRELLREAGVQFAFSNYGGYVPAGRADPLDLERTNVGVGMSRALFEAVVRRPRMFARW